MRRSLLIALILIVGAGIGVGVAYAAWRPYGEGSLTQAVLRKCGTREAPRGEERCSVLVDDALSAWFQHYYAGEAPPLRSLDTTPVTPVQARTPPDSALEAVAQIYASKHPICRTSVGVRFAWLRGFRGEPELFRDATDTTYLNATHDAHLSGAAYRSELAPRGQTQ